MLKKSGDLQTPIALLPVIDKIFEKILRQQLSNYFENNKLLYDCRQYGFRKGSGIENAVVNVTNHIRHGLDQGYNGDAGIFYDFSKAFDLVDHEMLFKRLEYYGIRNATLRLLRGYLTNGKQYVELNNIRSFAGDIQHGVSQGSALGQLLFTVYINDIVNLQLNGKIYLYADDIFIFYSYKHKTTYKAYVKKDADIIFEYARINKLVIKTSKTKIIRFKPYSVLMLKHVVSL